MRYNPDIHNRRSIRLNGYDYSKEGYYYITICTQNRECLFGKISDTKIILNDCGKMISKIWKDMEKYNSGIKIDKFIVMPNHIHGIIQFFTQNKDVGADHRVRPDIDNNAGKNRHITRPDIEHNDVGADHRVRPDIKNDKKGQAQWPAPTIKIKSLSEIIKQFKTLVTKKHIDGARNKLWNPFDKKLWQRNFYERIIRDNIELDKTRKYINENPLNWKIDDNYKE